MVLLGIELFKSQVTLGDPPLHPAIRQGGKQVATIEVIATVESHIPGLKRGDAMHGSGKRSLLPDSYPVASHSIFRQVLLKQIDKSQSAKIVIHLLSKLTTKLTF